MDKKEEEKPVGVYIDLGSDHLYVKSSTTVKMTEEFHLFSPDGPITLPVSIEADLSKVPSKYHEVFLNILTSKYMNKVSFQDNPFSECRKPNTKPWYIKMWGFLSNN